MAWPCEPQEIRAALGTAASPHWDRRSRMSPIHGQIPYPSLPASAGPLSSAELSFPSLLRFILVSSVICKEPL